MKSIRIQNLRNLKDTGEIDISPITVLVGQKQFRKEYLATLPEGEADPKQKMIDHVMDLLQAQHDEVEKTY